MDECQEHVANARDVPDDLIEQLTSETPRGSSWSPAKRQLLRRILAALDGYQLARRAVAGRRGAAFVARVHADRCASRVRRALAAAGWQRPLCQWLHGLLLQKLGRDALALYLEVVQTLTSKTPSLAARLTWPAGPRHGPLSAETLAPLLRRPWEPATHIISQHKLRRLPNNPLLVLVPSSPCHGSDASRLGFGTGRLDFWHRQLSALGKVVAISVFEGGAPSRGITVSESLSHIMAMCRSQVAELRRPGRPLVLLGWGAAGLVAAHLALVEPVSAVVGLGFPYWSAAGRRGEPDDPLLESRTPTLLLVGQSASDAAPHELELMRDRMRAETGLVVVGGADRRLLVNRHKRQREGLTQSMVDRAVMEEVSEFLTNILTQQLDGTLPVFPRLPTPPLCREDAVLRNLARERRRRPVGPAKQRARPTRSGRPRGRPRAATQRPEPGGSPAADDRLSLGAAHHRPDPGGGQRRDAENDDDAAV
ncbi:KAT8 regulatory NSL complex subunit 3-like [Pollicipes pollicipes]|uniref:KAT8 regulatory NSL complex subunit 3-like n=1 Tax=Pollicipes pollicipes TaxID=41117 RepID=UPI0018849DC9|nr:KAT8 regulatory NSL complex subunit 3-like [Pollicipes pollicipes]